MKIEKYVMIITEGYKTEIILISTTYPLYEGLCNML